MPGGGVSVRRIVLLTVAGMVVVFLAVSLSLWFHQIIVHLSQETGTSNSSSRAYGFWSGFGSDLGELALIGGVWMGLRKLNCHVKGCWRIGHHSLEGTPYVVCRKHHPDVPDKGASLHHIHDMHRRAKECSA